jgi:hypothetical protein
VSISFLVRWFLFSSSSPFCFLTFPRRLSLTVVTFFCRSAPPPPWTRAGRAAPTRSLHPRQGRRCPEAPPASVLPRQPDQAGRSSHVKDELFTSSPPSVGRPDFYIAMSSSPSTTSWVSLVVVDLVFELGEHFRYFFPRAGSFSSPDLCSTAPLRRGLALHRHF